MEATRCTFRSPPAVNLATTASSAARFMATVAPMLALEILQFKTVTRACIRSEYPKTQVFHRLGTYVYYITMSCSNVSRHHKVPAKILNWARSVW